MKRRDTISMTPPEHFLTALGVFAERLTAKFSATGAGEPEGQLKGPVDELFRAFSELTSGGIVLKGESRLGDFPKLVALLNSHEHQVCFSTTSEVLVYGIALPGRPF